MSTNGTASNFFKRIWVLALITSVSITPPTAVEGDTCPRSSTGSALPGGNLHEDCDNTNLNQENVIDDHVDEPLHVEPLGNEDIRLRDSGPVEEAPSSNEDYDDDEDPGSEGCSIGTANINAGEVKQWSQKLWKADKNRVRLDVDLQDRLEQGSSSDVSYNKLFKKVPPQALDNEVTKQLLTLFDNYFPTKKKEETTPAESKEVDAFLNAVMKTDVMDLTRQFLSKKGLVSVDPSEFRKEMKRLWFTNYDRNPSGNLEFSSGFEHVFIGEWKGPSTSGFHNWVRAYYLEQKNKLNYHGYFVSKGVGDVSLLTFQFDWDNHLKPVTSMFLGTSPEFDLSLFTLCYYSFPGKGCRVQLDSTGVTLISIKHCYRGHHYPATVYPSS